MTIDLTMSSDEEEMDQLEDEGEEQDVMKLVDDVEGQVIVASEQAVDGASAQAVVG